jgi:hypothetical protein
LAQLVAYVARVHNGSVYERALLQEFNMAEKLTIEQRLAALEHDVKELKQRLVPTSANGNWVDEIAGSMLAFPEFEEVVRLGREIRDTSDDFAN